MCVCDRGREDGKELAIEGGCERGRKDGRDPGIEGERLHRYNVKS